MIWSRTLSSALAWSPLLPDRLGVELDLRRLDPLLLLLVWDRRRVDLVPDRVLLVVWDRRLNLVLHRFVVVWDRRRLDLVLERVAVRLDLVLDRGRELVLVGTFVPDDPSLPESAKLVGEEAFAISAFTSSADAPSSTALASSDAPSSLAALASSDAPSSLAAMASSDAPSSLAALATDAPSSSAALATDAPSSSAALAS